MKQIKRTLKPKFIVVFHQNWCGDDVSDVLTEDGSWSYSFSSITKAKKRMKQDINEFRKVYPNAIVVMDSGDLRATIEMPYTNWNGKLDTIITEWKIVMI